MKLVPAGTIPIHNFSFYFSSELIDHLYTGVFIGAFETRKYVTNSCSLLYLVPSLYLYVLLSPTYTTSGFTNRPFGYFSPCFYVRIEWLIFRITKKNPTRGSTMLLCIYRHIFWQNRNYLL